MLKKFNVRVCRFSASEGPQSAGAETFLLPVDSPDEEHAVSAAMSNAVAFTKKVNGTEVVPVAFVCLGVMARE